MSTNKITIQSIIPSESLQEILKYSGKINDSQSVADFFFPEISN